MATRITIFAAQAIQEARRESRADRVTIANQAAAEARADAPVLTGAFRNGIGVEVGGDTVSIVDNDPTSIYKEYGTHDTPAHATLTRAASRHGRYSGMRPRGT